LHDVSQLAVPVLLELLSSDEVADAETLTVFEFGQLGPGIWSSRCKSAWELYRDRLNDDGDGHGVRHRRRDWNELGFVSNLSNSK
jgi:hypothetical protein